MQMRLLKEENMPQAISIAASVIIEETGHHPSYEEAASAFDGITGDDFLLGIFNETRLIGLIMAQKSTDKESFKLCNLYVDPAYRKSGLGRQLFQEILALVDAASPKKPTTLQVDKSKPHLKSVYEEYGFQTRPQCFLVRLFQRMHSMERAPAQPLLSSQTAHDAADDLASDGAAEGAAHGADGGFDCGLADGLAIR